jgi:hypothetical protein
VAEVVPNGEAVARARELADLHLQAPEVTRRKTRIMTTSDHRVRGGNVGATWHQQRWCDGIEHILGREGAPFHSLKEHFLFVCAVCCAERICRIVLPNPWTESRMQDVKVEASFGSPLETTAAGEALRLSPSVSRGPVRTLAGLVADEVSELRKLAQDRRAVSFALSCHRARLGQASSAHFRIEGLTEPAFSPSPTDGSLGEVTR